MDVRAWQRKNDLHKLWTRIKHPPFLYKKAGGVSAVVHRADGSTEVLGTIADLYMPRKGWSVAQGMFRR